MDAESSDDARQGTERAGHKSKLAAMEEIRSESQQMVREAAVGLPYHRPRPRTLEDFLNQVVAKHKKHSGKENAGRKSKSAAMQEIRSESRGRAAVPPPRPRTLEEFLNCKKGAPEIVTWLKMERRVIASPDAADRKGWTSFIRV